MQQEEHTSHIRWRSVAITVLQLVITALFIPAISAKLRHPAEWGRLFAAWGYPPWGAVAISILEIVALITLWIHRLAMTAMAILMVTLTGATATWLMHGPTSTAAYPGAILLLLIVLAWLRASADRERSLTRHAM